MNVTQTSSDSFTGRPVRNGYGLVVPFVVIGLWFLLLGAATIIQVFREGWVYILQERLAAIVMGMADTLYIVAAVLVGRLLHHADTRFAHNALLFLLPALAVVVFLLNVHLIQITGD